jgi:hypothetical protein
MNKQELKEKVDKFIGSVGALTLNYHYSKTNKTPEKAKDCEEKFNKQWQAAREQLIELLDIKTHEHQNTDIFK